MKLDIHLFHNPAVLPVCVYIYIYSREIKPGPQKNNYTKIFLKNSEMVQVHNLLYAILKP